ncbi:hypothetical protein AB0451_03345 [Streptomyces sp. NPDC052000]|uniref:hypothetical protein n=1 Tax=Streptomyces sp. NPDC052000 TaxID=3155676 RepID=UPI00344E22A3
MDDLAAPVTGTYANAPREPLLTLDEAREAVRLLMHFSETGDADSEEALDAYALATDIAGRLPSE